MPTDEQWAVSGKTGRKNEKRDVSPSSIASGRCDVRQARRGASPRETGASKKAIRLEKARNEKHATCGFFACRRGKKRGESVAPIEDDLGAPRRDRGASFFRASFQRREDDDDESSSALDAGVGRKRTNQAVLGGLPREVADVAAAAIGGGGVAERVAAVAARLGGGGLGGRLILADGDVAVAEGVAWRMRRLGGVQRVRSRSGGRTRRDRARGRVSSTRENPQPSPFAKNCDNCA